MDLKQQIQDYISSQPEPKQADMKQLHQIIMKLKPEAKLWFLDGKNSEGKIVSNPNIGYGLYTITYADGTAKEFYQVGMSANTTGISIYIMGISDKTFLSRTYAERLGKATVTGYCIKFRSLKDIHLPVLEEAIQSRLEAEH